MSLSMWIDCLWIALDVAFCVYVEIELHSLTSPEWRSDRVCGNFSYRQEFRPRKQPIEA